MTTWVVIYQTALGEVFGWFCKASRPSHAEEKFWQVMIMLEERKVKCVCELKSDAIDTLLALYGGELE